MMGSRTSRLRLAATTATLIVFGGMAREQPRPPAACGAVQQVTVNAGDASTVASASISGTTV